MIKSENQDKQRKRLGNTHTYRSGGRECGEREERAGERYNNPLHEEDGLGAKLMAAVGGKLEARGRGRLAPSCLLFFLSLASGLSQQESILGWAEMVWSPCEVEVVALRSER